MSVVRTLVFSLLTLLLLGTSLGSVQAAPTRTLLWGIQNGCESLPEADRYLASQLQAAGKSVWLLRSPQGQPLPVCSPHQSVRCGEALRSSCQAAQGQLLGGTMVRGKEVLRFRLWLYDLASGQVAYQDDYCQSCDPMSALAAQATRLLASPQPGSRPGQTPMYCGQDQALPKGASTSRPVHLVVFGEGKHKPVLLAALKAAIVERGRPVQLVALDAKTYTIDVLQRIVAGQPEAQVVGVELLRDGKVGLFVYDARTEQTADRVLDCPDCAQNKDSLIGQVLPAVGTLLTRCFGQQCGGSGHQGPPPPEACAPFATAACPGTDSLFPPGPRAIDWGASPAASRLDARKSATLQALVWSGVGLSALTTLGLFIANSTESGTHTDARGFRISDTLLYPAWSTLGVTLGLIGLAVPTSVLLSQATPSHPPTTPAPDSQHPAPLLIECPQ
jgi:hypothetical protein